MADTPSPNTAWLHTLLAREAGCDYLRRHGAPRTLVAFRAQVPLISHADLQPELARMARGEGHVLFMGRPVAWERTGGSSAGAKLVPYAAAGLADMRAELGPWVMGLLAQHGLHDGGSGQIYLALSPVLRPPEQLAGVPVGLGDAAYLGEALAARIVPMLAVPPAVATAPGRDAWLAATLAHLKAARSLRLISVWSPTFLHMLLDALEAGGANPRALWPRLRCISCWDAGASAPYAAQLAQRLPQARVAGKGLMATEGVATAPDAQGRPVLARRGFFEFLPAQAPPSTQPLLPHQLQPGQVYELVMTTASGLYRYRTGDLLRCLGFSAGGGQAGSHAGGPMPSTTPHSPGQPVLRFEGRASLRSDLVGEKLDEAFVSACLAQAFDAPEGAATPATRFLLPDAAARAYRLLSSQPVSRAELQRLEAALHANPQYAYARQLGQLGPLAAHHVPDLHARLEQAMLRSGGRLADVKPLGLRVTDLDVFQEWLNPTPTEGTAP